MSRETFNVGDIVRHCGSFDEFAVVGERPGYPGMLVCRPLHGEKSALFFRPRNLSLVLPAAGIKAGS